MNQSGRQLLFTNDEVLRALATRDPGWRFNSIKSVPQLMPEFAPELEHELGHELGRAFIQ